MTRFRYDVILRKRGNAMPDDAPTPPTVPCPEPCSIDALRLLLRDEPVALHVSGIRNARVAADVRAAVLAAGGQGGTVGDLQAIPDTGLPPLDPEDVRTLDPRYEAVIEFSRVHPDLIDVTFRHRTRQRALAPVRRDVARDASRATNTPFRRAASGTALISALREQARQKLPEYMIPSAFVIMDALPLTPNGKIDRKALPAPESPKSASTTHKPPQNDVERGIVSVLRDLLGAVEVGVDDNFFDLGANSLMMVQASVRLRSVLGRPVPLVRLFQHPSARALAVALGDAGQATDAAVKQSQDRAQIRKDAMQRPRGGARTPRSRS